MLATPLTPERKLVVEVVASAEHAIITGFKNVVRAALWIEGHKQIGMAALYLDLSRLVLTELDKVPLKQGFAHERRAFALHPYPDCIVKLSDPDQQRFRQS